MQSTMMDFPLTLTHILKRASQLFGASAIVSRLPDKSLHRYHYRDFHRRALALGGALQAMGLAPGDRVATLMWNHYAHLEAYFGIPCAGFVLHTHPRTHTRPSPIFFCPPTLLPPFFPFSFVHAS